MAPILRACIAIVYYAVFFGGFVQRCIDTNASSIKHSKFKLGLWEVSHANKSRISSPSSET
jgi:hypothetical protein